MSCINHNEILYMSWQCKCRDLCKISLWWVEYILNQSTANFGQISNLIKISLVGWVPGMIPRRICVTLQLLIIYGLTKCNGVILRGVTYEGFVWWRPWSLLHWPCLECHPWWRASWPWGWLPRTMAVPQNGWPQTAQGSSPERKKVMLK